MKKTSMRLLKACSLSVALLGSVAVIAAVSLPDVAYAKSGNDNGNGGGNGNGNGGGNGGGNGNGKSDSSGGGNGKADKSGKGAGGDSAKVKSKTKSKTKAEDGTKAKSKPKAKAKPKKKTLAEELGVHPSELGALNAAHANPNALANASPNSRVGRIAAYRDAVLAGQVLVADLAAAQAELETLDPPTRSSADVATELALATEEVGLAEAEVARLEQALADAGGTDAVIEADLAAARETLAEAEGAEATLQGEYDAAFAYETLEAEIADLTQKVADQPALERSLLEAAANKTVTDEVEAAVKKLLGL